ncbi:MAG: ABC transporter permease [Anaerolineaceae bacterium]|nr:ABC transporter permease [Anaerolineaceae bacterium]
MDVARHLILPTITLAVVSASGYMLIMRSSVVEVLAEDYILTAKAKGLSTAKILRDHALKNAMLPMVTIIALTLAIPLAAPSRSKPCFPGRALAV